MWPEKKQNKNFSRCKNIYAALLFPFWAYPSCALLHSHFSFLLWSFVSVNKCAHIHTRMFVHLLYPTAHPFIHFTLFFLQVHKIPIYMNMHIYLFYYYYAFICLMHKIGHIAHMQFSTLLPLQFSTSSFNICAFCAYCIHERGARSWRAPKINPIWNCAAFTRRNRVTDKQHMHTYVR